MTKVPFNLNRRLLVTAGVLTLLAVALFVAVTGQIAEVAPFFPGALLALAILFWHPRWMYLVAGIGVALFPLVVLFVFGAYQAIIHPGTGLEGYAVMLLFLAALVGLIGGIAGFAQSRSGTAPPATDMLRAPQGVASVLLATFFLGMIVSSALAAGDYKTLADAKADYVVPEQTIQLVAKDFQWGPRDVQIPAGKLVALHIDNQDNVVHTFAYTYGGKHHEAILPAKTGTDLYFRFDQAATIQYWCGPHSAGEGDADPGSMWGTMTVA